MRYGKISEAIWSDERFQALSDRSKLLYIYLLSCENCNSIGIFRIGYGTMEDEFGRNRQDIEEGVNELIDSGLIGYRNKWLWFNKFLRWNQPINPNHAKQCAAYINDCAMKGAPVEAVWGFLSNAFGILNQLRFQTKDGRQKTYYDEFKQALDRTTVTEYLGGEDNLMACLSGKPYKAERTIPKGSPTTFKSQENVTETLQEHCGNTAQRLGTNKDNNKDKDNNNTRQDNDHKSIGLACNNDRINYQISLTCKDGILYAVKPETIDIARRLYPRLDINKASQEIARDTEIDRVIRPEPNCVDSFYLNAMKIRGGSR